MISVSFITTQMQLINCVEAIHQFGCKENALIIASNDEERQKRIQTLLDILSPYFAFDNVYILCKGVAKGWFGGLKYVYKQKKEISRLVHGKKIDVFFSTNFKQAQQKFIIKKLFNLNSDLQIVLVDDGLAVCEIAVRRSNELRTNKSDTHYISRAYKLLYEAEVRCFVPRHIVFFTVYKDISISQEDSLIYNNYSFVKRHKIGDSEIGIGEVVVLGQPLVNSNYLGLDSFSSDTYCEYIINAIRAIGFPFSRIVYFPHPAENITISLSSTKSSNFSVVENNIPIELILLHVHQEVPILGFYTSALVNIVELDNDRRVYSIYFKEVNKSEIKRIREVVNNAYKYIESKGIPVLFHVFK